MRKSYTIVLAAAAVLGLTATYSVVSTDISSLVGLKTTGLPPDVRIVNAAALDSQTIPAPIASANNEFAMKFYKQVADTDGNIFFSPAAIYAAFSLLYEGSRYDTASQMQDVFGFEPDYMIRHNQTAHMLSMLSREDQHTKLELANALWLADWIEPYPRFLDAAHHTYLAQAETVDFTAPDSMDKINEWATKMTHNKIKKVSNSDDVNNMTTITINNAIYFKTTWHVQFLESGKRLFHLNSTHSVVSDFMTRHIPINHIHSDGVQVFKLLYKGDKLGNRLSMLMILPDDIDGIIQLEETMSAALMDQWLYKLDEYGTNQLKKNLSAAIDEQRSRLFEDGINRQLEETKFMALAKQWTDNDFEPKRMELTVPKFEFKTNYDLDKILANMGMPDAFDEQRADLLGLAPAVKGNYHVTQAVQDAHVQVNGTGTEAGPRIPRMGGEPGAEPPYYRTIDHPFIFIIYDEQSGAILFMGRISDPTV